MRPIKFRGKSLRTAELIYGDLLQHANKTAICTSAFMLVFYAYRKQGVYGVEEVDPKTVAQLVGYDADGKEVYEGDVLVNDSGGEFQASFKSVITGLKNPCYCRYLENLKHRKYYRLKGK